MTSSQRRVVIVGAGLGGLLAACHLATKGVEVTVLERGDRPGGRAGSWAEACAACWRTPSGLRMRNSRPPRSGPPRPAHRASFWDVSAIHVRAGREAMRDEVRSFAGVGEVVGYDRFVAWITRLYEIEFDAFIDRDLSSPLDLLRTPGALARLTRAVGSADRRTGSTATSRTNGSAGRSRSRRCTPG